MVAKKVVDKFAVGQAYRLLFASAVKLASLPSCALLKNSKMAGIFVNAMLT